MLECNTGTASGQGAVQQDVRIRMRGGCRGLTAAVARRRLAVRVGGSADEAQAWCGLEQRGQRCSGWHRRRFVSLTEVTEGRFQWFPCFINAPSAFGRSLPRVRTAESLSLTLAAPGRQRLRRAGSCRRWSYAGPSANRIASKAMLYVDVGCSFRRNRWTALR